MEKNEKKIAIIGNPNSGKTTLFNLLTGSNQKTGNWSGVTVERIEGKFETENFSVTIVDLPGLWGFFSDSLDETIAKKFLIEEDFDLILTIVDGTMLERSLILTLSLLDRKVPILLVINMCDELEDYGITIYPEKVKQFIPVDAVLISALKSIGLEKLIEAIDKKLAQTDILESDDKEEFLKNNGILPEDFYQQVDLIYKKLKEFLPNYSKSKLWYCSIFFLCMDSSIYDVLPLSIEQKLYISALAKEGASVLARQYKQDPVNILLDYRYSKAKALTNEISKKKETGKTRFSLSDSIDRILTSRFLGLIVFFIALFLLFQLTFTFSKPLSNLITTGFDLLSKILENVTTKNSFQDFIKDLLLKGLLPPLSAVGSFVPVIAILFFLIALLEDSGYMARASFMSDKLMHIAGLHGKSFIPLILGFGCNVPAIMAARTLETPKDRIITILISPLISCSARLPIYLLFVSIFFPKNPALIVFSLYLIGLILAILIGRIFKKIFFKYDEVTLLIDLPPYRVPSLKNAIRSMSTRVADFIKRIIIYILVASMILFFLSYFPDKNSYGSDKSIIGKIASIFSPILSPLGFGYWQILVSLIFGFIGKELVVGSLATLIPSINSPVHGILNFPNSLMVFFNPASAYAFLIFTLLYVPCIATVAIIRKEAGKKWMWISIAYQLALAYVASFVAYSIGKLFI
ncbi:MAG: ferrous iron transport protein B [Spirochaetales bacterium]|nr:ferrous iron transport protein B [Spirochaetales bacterium]